MQSSMTQLFGERYAVALVFLFLLFIVVGTTPFIGGSGVSIDKSGAGDSSRQIILVLLLMLAIPALVLRRQQLRQILLSSQITLLLMGWAVASVLWSDAIAITTRRLLGTLLLACLTLVAASLSPRRMMNVLLAVTGLVMVIDYAGLLVIPKLAFNHEGLWAGLHPHKNVAGYVSALAALLWLFIGGARSSMGLISGGIAWAVFCWFTGSRTSFALLLMIIPIGLLFSAGLRRGFNRNALTLLVFLVIGLVPLALAALTVMNTEDFTFSRRIEIWQFVWTEVWKTPLFGVGYSTFWAIGDMAPALLRGGPFVAQYTEAHNGYLDILISLGFVGLFLTLMTLAMPFRVLWLHRDTDTAMREARLCALLILTFGILHNGLESSLLEGLSFLWTLMLLSIWVITSDISGVVESTSSSYVYTRRGLARKLHVTPADSR